jgi:anti-sigma regulatory factor (Ser/Thr protein kinase)
MLQTRHPIEEETQVGEARRQALQLAQHHGLDAAAAGRVAIAATELATNLLRHAGGGELLVQALLYGDGPLIELMAIDRGPGMQDVERCLADGYSTAGSAGTGLGAIRRLAAEFDIYSIAGEGTVVLARLGATAYTGRSQTPRFGAINVAVTGESECGDSWRLATHEDVTAIMIADGLGHGSLAAHAARCATAAFEAAPFDAPREVLERANRATSGTRGAAAACACVPPDGAVTYAGVGNIVGSLVSHGRTQGLISHGGTLGLRVSRLQQFEYRRAAASALLVMHSDGISARWDLKSRPGLLQRHPAIVAAILYRDHARGRDDSTVVVMAA